jgi:hypothetical protein
MARRPIRRACGDSACRAFWHNLSAPDQPDQSLAALAYVGKARDGMCRRHRDEERNQARATRAAASPSPHQQRLRYPSSVRWLEPISCTKSQECPNFRGRKMARRMIGVQWDLKESNAVRTTRRQSGPGDEGKIDRARADGGGRRPPRLLRIGSDSCPGSPARPGSAAGRVLCQSFRAGPGLPASTSICSTWPIHGRQANGCRIRGRVLGRQFERFARIARLS